MELPSPEQIGRLPPDQQARAAALLRRLFGGERLPDFIRRVSPHRPPPPHFRPIIDLLERAAAGEQIRACISMPPRHGKTVLILHALAWWLSRSPADTCAYFSYNETQGRSKSRIARALALLAGVRLAKDSASLAEWRTELGGGLLAGGAGGGLTGQGVSGLLVVDDPFKNRREADSPVTRDAVWEWFNEVGFTRLEGASVLVIHTRWHEDDLIGRLDKMGGWEIVNVPAVAEDSDPLGRQPGEALWPERFSAARLEKTRVQIGDYSFAALYQGRPRPRGAVVFGPARHFDPVTETFRGCSVVIAADPAASEKTTGDWSTIVALYVRARGPGDVTVFVREVYRRQVQIPQFVADLRAFQARHSFAEVHVEAVAGFKAVPQMLRAIDPALRVREIHPVGDKFTRAQPVAAAWNAGNVLVPSNAPWLKDFLRELSVFTGVKDEHDDQVDSLAHAYNNVRLGGGLTMLDVAA